MVGKRTCLGLNPVCHIVEIFEDCVPVHMVEDMAGGTGRSVDYTGERVETHHGINMMLALRHLEFDYIAIESVGKIHCLAEVFYRIRGEKEGYEFAGAGFVDM